MTGDNLAEPTSGIAGQKRKVSLSSAASKGSKYTLGSAKKVSALSAPAPQYLVDAELLQRLSRACKKHCLAKLFKSSDALIKFLKQGLAGTCNMSDAERNEKLFTLFKATVQNPPPSGVGPTDKFEHHWSLPAVGNVQCRLCWGAYYGFSKHKLDVCSKGIRQNWLYTGKVTSAFSDDTVYHNEYTYEDARGMIVSNLVSEEGSFVGSAGKDYKPYRRDALTDLYFVCIILQMPKWLLPGSRRAQMCKYLHTSGCAITSTILATQRPTARQCTSRSTPEKVAEELASAAAVVSTSAMASCRISASCAAKAGVSASADAELSHTAVAVVGTVPSSARVGTGSAAWITPAFSADARASASKGLTEFESASAATRTVEEGFLLDLELLAFRGGLLADTGAHGIAVAVAMHCVHLQTQDPWPQR
jgi:hypothetical protein